MIISRSILFFCLNVLFCSPLCAQDFVVEPGRRVGKIEIGASRDAVHRLLGKPAKMFSTHKKLVVDSWSNNKTGNQLEVIYQAGNVVQIKVSSPRFSTPDGVSTNSSLAEVRRAYSPLKKTTYFYNEESGRGLDYLEDPQRGVTFVFASPSTDPPETLKAWVIIVHRPGSRAIPVEIKDPTNKVE